MCDYLQYALLRGWICPDNKFNIDDHFCSIVNLNLNNVFNKFYYSQIGSSLDGFQLYGIPGAGRTLTASVDYEF